MDFISIKDKITIVDYKSDHKYIVDEYINAYYSQIMSYVNAMKLIYPKYEIEGYIYSIRLSKMIKIV